MHALEQWLLQRLSSLTRLEPSAISLDLPLESLGLSSQEAVGLSGELEEYAGVRLSPTLVWEYPTIRLLAGFIAGQVHGDVQPAAPAAPTAAATYAPLAIVGMACRFPGANSPEELWTLLAEGRSAITEIPPDRWRNSDFYDARPGVPGKMNSKWGGFLRDIELFDPGFFGISRREAARMDPSQRLLLEVAWEAMEDACIAPPSLSAMRTGVFVGISTNDYMRRQTGDPTRIDAYAASGNAMSIAANRLSYVFNLCGPSIAVDTACASSLTALHLAARSLAAGECDAALVGGVNVILSPETSVAFSQARMLAADGRCKTFDASADGYVRGEGCGVLLLKRLDDAMARRDRIHAIVRGSAVAHGGRSNGLMAPSRRALQQIMEDALRAAGSAPARISCVEVQGTGTPLGDTIEFEALRTVFEGAGAQACALGSIKTNLGHLEAAAGTASLMKVVLSLEHQTFTPHLHLRDLHPNINFQGTPFHVPQTLSSWPDASLPRQAGVTAYGFGGAAVHVVLEEAPQAPAEVPPDSVESSDLSGLLCLSARTDDALRQLAMRYIEYLEREETLPLSTLCVNAQCGRAHFSRRLAVWGATREAICERLGAFLDDSGGAHLWQAHADESAVQIRIDRDTRDCPEREAGAGTSACPPLAPWLAEHYVRGAVVDWESFYRGISYPKASLPAYPFERVRCWMEALPEELLSGRPRRSAPAATAPSATPQRTRVKDDRAFSIELLGATPEERLQVLRAYLEEKIAHALGIGREELNPEQSLLELGLDSLMMMEIMGALSQDLCVVIYPREVFDRPTLGQLTEYVAQELDTLARNNGRGRGGNGHHDAPPTAAGAAQSGGNGNGGAVAQAAAKGIDFFKLRLYRGLPNGSNGNGQNPPAVFLLSTPRSGSTLLRVMLAGHSALFCPPELHLLPFKTMSERQRELEGTGLEPGLARALMEAQGLPAEEAERMVAMLVAGDVPVQNVYKLLQRSGDKTLVDKSPTYSGAVEIMQRAERLFQHPRYLYLARHPLAVIDSLVHNRLDQMVATRAASPHQTAEAIWTLGNYNIRTFLRGVDSSRWHTIMYEDLVRVPEETMRAVSGFLQIDFEPSLLDPYAGTRMTDGLHPAQLSVGDPGFLLHQGIDPVLGEKWREISLPDPLKPATARLAAEMGYELAGEQVARRIMPGVLGAAMEGTL